MVSRIVKAVILVALVAVRMLSGQVSFAATTAPGAGYWHTNGSKILDSNNQPVRIAGINWYGFETTDLVAHGLSAQDYKVILQTIQANGFNTIRLPFSNQMVESPVVPSSIQYSNATGAINTDLKGLNSLQIMDAIIDYAGQIGLRVILDDHRSEAGNSAEANGLWYTAAYPESAWIADWQSLVTRYQGNTTVIGVDLRNEPHNATAGGSCWDCGTATNDWHLAAQRAGNAVLTLNPKLLVFVEGTDAYNNNYYFWGGNLQGVQTSPVKLTVANQLVYSAHDYGPTEFAQSWFNGSTTYDTLVSTWTSNWAYISLNGIAPVWVGEFGTVNDDASVQATGAGSQGQWFSGLVQFLGANPSIQWTYWALNGEDRYGLLDSTYDSSPVNALKEKLLSGIQFPLSGGTPVSTPAFTLAQNPSTIVAASSSTDLGTSGNTTEVTYTALVNNRTASDQASVVITLTLPASAVMVNEASSGSAATCTPAASSYTCNFVTIPVAGSGGISLTAIYPASGLTFDSNGQAPQTVNATAEVGTQPLPAATVITVVDKDGNQSGASESIVATAAPGNSFAYGQQGTVSFSLSPTPSSPIPISSFSAQLDGSGALTITSTGANSYQIPVGLLSGGTHSIAIHLAASSSYAAASANVALTVQKAVATLTVPGSPITGNYGAAIPVTLNLAGISGTGFAAPSGSATLVIDTLPALTASVSGGLASFAAPASLSANTHSLNFSYAGDANFAAQTTASTLVVKQGQIVVTALPASRAFGAPNPAFTGSITGVLSNDGITVTYLSQANATTPVGTYVDAPFAIMPTLVDPNNRLPNYTTSVTEGALTITSADTTTNSSGITWPTPAAIVYGTPLTSAQLNASAATAGTFTYKPVSGTILGAGPQTLSVTFQPTSGTAATAQVTLLVNQASTTSTLTAVNATTAGNITLNAVVKSINGGDATGSVQFLDGSTSLAAVTLSSTGMATYNVTLSNGPHTLTAVYSGDVNNLASTSTALLEAVSGGLDFQLSSNPKMLTLSAGQSMPVTLSVFSADGFTGVVTFKCTGLPNGSTCSFDPATIQGNASSTAQSTTLTIGLPKANFAKPTDTGMSPRRAGMLMLPAVLLGLFLLKQRRHLQRTLGMCILAMVFLVNVAIGCASSNIPGSTSPGGNASSVGSYNALITATSPAAVQTLTIPITLAQ